MTTLTPPPGNPADPLPPPGTTPYFRRLADFRAAVDAEAARRGLPPEPWPA
ncbi:MAG TPA: hypothetical protein VGI96_05730 [Streptosporangiaceae bacterium]